MGTEYFFVIHVGMIEFSQLVDYHENELYLVYGGWGGDFEKNPITGWIKLVELL